MAITVVFYACWALFGAVWVAGAAVGRKQGPAVREGSGRDWTIYVALGAIVIAEVIPESIWRHVTVSGTAPEAIGAVLLLVGTIFTLWARLALGTMWSAGVVAREEHSLRTDGPYRVTRHPIYTGLCAMLVGSALVRDLGASAVIAVAILVALVFKARAEERLLLGAFPGDYERYRSHVPMFIPGLRLSRS